MNGTCIGLLRHPNSANVERAFSVVESVMTSLMEWKAFSDTTWLIYTAPVVAFITFGMYRFMWLLMTQKKCIVFVDMPFYDMLIVVLGFVSRVFTHWNIIGNIWVIFPFSETLIIFLKCQKSCPFLRWWWKKRVFLHLRHSFLACVCCHKGK